MPDNGANIKRPKWSENEKMNEHTKLPFIGKMPLNFIIAVVVEWRRSSRKPANFRERIQAIVISTILISHHSQRHSGCHFHSNHHKLSIPGHPFSVIKPSLITKIANIALDVTTKLSSVDFTQWGAGLGSLGCMVYGRKTV